MDKAIHQPVMSIVVGVSNEPVQESSASSNGNYKAKGGNNGAGNAMNTSPRRTYGYSFNNGSAKQPILRAHECNLVEEEVINRNVLPGAVGLNFNFWMEHNYIVDRDVTDLALGALNNKRSSRIVRQDTANKVSNVLVLSIQGVDPRELNDSILDLPFLNCLSSMPIRHVHEESSPLISFDEPAYAQSNTDQQWQYLEVCNQNAKLLWCDKPSVRLSSIAGLATTELLTQYTLTFLGVHTQWQDDIIMYSELGSNGTTNSSATVNAFQELARQKLIGCKDAPAYMLQLMCDLTKPPQAGDIFGRCSRVKAKETGMFLYRPAKAPTAGRLIILWQRTKEIDILEEVPSAAVAHNKCVIPSSTESTNVLAFVKVQPTAVAGSRNRFKEVLDLVLTLSKAVSRAMPAVGKENATSSLNDSKVQSVEAVMSTEEEDEGMKESSAVVEASMTADTTASTNVSTGAGGDNVNSASVHHEYFSADLQASLRQEYQSNSLKSALERLVLSPAMQDIMGYATSRANGYEDFLDTSDRSFHRKPENNNVIAVASGPGGALTRSSSSNSSSDGSTGGRKRSQSLEEGEEMEDMEETAVPEVLAKSRTTKRLNKKTYFHDNDEDVDDKDGKDASGSDDADDDDMAALMAVNARKRKAQEAALEEQQAKEAEEAEEVEEGEEREDPGASSLDRLLAAKRAKLAAAVSTTATTFPLPPCPPPPRPPVAPALRSVPSSAAKPPAQQVNSRNKAAAGDGAPEEVRTVTSKSTGGVDGKGAAEGVHSSVFSSPSVLACRSAPVLIIDSVTVPKKNAIAAAEKSGSSNAPSNLTAQKKESCITQLAPHLVTPLHVCALDCEMCSTAAGLELTRLTVLCPQHGVVFDSLVRPELPILDYHTEFSGITQESMEKVTTTFAEVQEVLRRLISQDTIIVGHSADTDLKVLKLIHGRVVDTAALFPHPSGLPFKHALKKLAKEFLHKDIQDGADGHDSVEDAAIAMELAFLKARLGDAVGVLAPWGEDPVPKHSVLQSLVHQLTGSANQLGGRQNEQQGPAACLLDIHVHGVPSVLGYDVPIWEEHAFGYRPEGDSCLNADLCRAALLEELRLLEQSLAAEREIQGEGAVSDTTRAAVEVLRLQVQQIHSTRHSSTEEAVAHAIQDLHSLSTTSPSSFSVHGDSAHSGDRAYQKKGVVFVDLTCPAGGEKDDDHSEHSRGSSLMMRDGEEDEFDRGSYSGGGCCDDGDDTDGAGGDGSGGDVDGEEGQRRDRRREPPLSPLQQVDRMAQQLYQAAPEGTLLVIVTQGSMQAMRLLASKKTRNRWEQAQIKRKQSQVGSTRVSWDAQLDEGRLIAAAAHATAGAVFVALKKPVSSSSEQSG